ncbi:hypothetical protein [Caballeronia ptereochthonis]|uniref:hypothetical protein n=1 Tax=Caballeronia ptereochthonis TaxID=1777144 RepID=UPI00117ED067|nr:hypothetical protein [Caballeronia ptereochthonis]
MKSAKMNKKTMAFDRTLKYLTRKNKADMILGFSSVRALAPCPFDADEDADEPAGSRFPTPNWPGSS